MNIVKSSIRNQSGLNGAFTLIELAVVIAMIVILAVTLLPALASSKEPSGRVACANNLKQISLATFTYVSDNDDYMPPLKWNGNLNDQFPYEMFRYTPVNVTPPTYDTAGGPYNLGVLWNSKIISNGQIFYCPSRESKSDSLTYQYYNSSSTWPFGGDPNALNPGYVRAGYYYYPQSRNAKVVTTTDAPVSNPIIPFWPANNDPANTAPYTTWRCVPLFKLSDVDLGKSMVTDIFMSGLSGLSHTQGGRPAGINAAFADGHVYWESVSGNPKTFDPILMELISENSSFGDDIRYFLSALKR